MTSVNTYSGVASNAPRTICPRCGYDLRGVVALWGDTCPLEGTCSECGLAYQWRDVIRIGFNAPEWCVEYAPGQGRSIRSAVVATYARSWLPWRFWSRLQMHHPVKPGRLALYVLAIVVLPLAVMYVAMQSVTALLVYVNALGLVRSEVPPTAADFAAVHARIDAWAGYEKYGDLPESEKQWAQEMARRFWGSRAAPREDDLEALAQREWETISRVVRRDLGQQALRVRWHLENPSQLKMGLFEAIGEAIFQPLDEESKGSIVLNGMESPYFPPRELLFGAIGFDRGASVLVAAAAIGGWMFVLAAFPLSLVLLVTTRRRAKVRWIHLLRPTVYGAAIPMTALVLATISIFLAVWPPMVVLALILAIVGTPVALFIWWYCAIRRHLKLQHAFAVTVIMMFLCSLAFIVAIYLLFGQD